MSVNSLTKEGNNMNHIQNAVAPLKAEAIEKAAEFALAHFNRVMQKMTESDWDLNVYAPRLHYYDYQYKSRQREREFVTTLFDYDYERNMHSDKHQFFKFSTERRDRFIQDARDGAAAQYDAFVEKLIVKVGEVDSAVLHGNHVWGYSILEVRKGEVVERWKTQQIVNFSKYNKVFNQWPTRKVKK
jgi:hypothetical protein